MKRHYLFLFFVALVIISGCAKKANSTFIDETPFELRNVNSQYFVIANATYSVPIKLVLYDSANPHAYFKVEAADLPTGVSSNSVNVYSNDTFTLTLDANNAVAGDHSFSIRCSAPRRRTQNYSVILHAGADCASSMTGTWNARDSGGISFLPPTTSADVTRGTEPGTINIDMYYRSHYCTLNCGDGTLTSVGTSQSSYYSLSAGNGTFTNNRMVVHYFYLGSSTYENWVILTR